MIGGRKRPIAIVSAALFTEGLAFFSNLIFDFRLSGIKGVQARGSAPGSKEYGKYQPLRALCLSLSRYR